MDESAEMGKMVNSLGAQKTTLCIKDEGGRGAAFNSSTVRTSIVRIQVPAWLNISLPNRQTDISPDIFWGVELISGRVHTNLTTGTVESY